jgi:archaemetzincin
VLRFVKTLLTSLILLLAAPNTQPDVPIPPGVWKPLPPPQPGDWRWRFPEKGQTFREYKAARPTRPTAERQTVYLQPFYTRPPPDRRELERVAALLGGFFAREVKTLPPGPLPASAYARGRQQVDVFRLARAMARSLPADALFVLAITDRDLFAGRLQYTFGWGSFKLRVGVLSTHRLAGSSEADGQRRRRRLLTLAAHESGHMLSLPHCTFFQCLMNGVRSLAEADARPALLCPVCRAKLCWNLGLDPLERYRGVGEAWARAGLKDAARRTGAAAKATREHARG